MQDKLNPNVMASHMHSAIKVNKLKEPFLSNNSILQIKAVKINPRNLPTSNNLNKHYLNYQMLIKS